jgi:hypothetical protein
MNRHQSTQTLDLEVSDLVNGRHIVITNLVESVFRIALKAQIVHKLSQALTEEGFIALVLFDYACYKVEASSIIELKLQ